MAKLLVMDDSAVIRGQIKTALASIFDGVFEAADGIEGLARLRENDDIVCLVGDVNMPLMDGITMCEKAAALPNWKNVTVIMLTAEVNADFKARAKAAGVRAWVTKPHDDKILLEVVKKLLKR